MNAFPVSALVYNADGKDPTTIIHDGMTLRDYFAAKAMLGLFNDTDLAMTQRELAEWAYKMADAMMEARNAAQ